MKSWCQHANSDGVFVRRKRWSAASWRKRKPAKMIARYGRAPRVRRARVSGEERIFLWSATAGGYESSGRGEPDGPRGPRSLEHAPGDGARLLLQAELVQELRHVQALEGVEVGPRREGTRDLGGLVEAPRAPEGEGPLDRVVVPQARGESIG